MHTSIFLSILLANDPKERQFWVNRIRAVAEQHTKSIAEVSEYSNFKII